MNHFFQRSETGAPSEYATIEQTIAPAALEAIINWLAALNSVQTPQSHEIGTSGTGMPVLIGVTME